jgi:ATP-dependent Lhr-like helicase
LQQVLARIDRGEIELLARDTREPSPFCYELLNANPYAFLDGGEIAERRTRAVATRRSLTVESVSDLGRLDPEAIARVRADAQPLVRTADELHDVLLSRIVVAADVEEGDARSLPLRKGEPEGVARFGDSGYAALEPTSEILRLFGDLTAARRATTIRRPAGRSFWAAAERLPAVFAAFPDAVAVPPLDVPEGIRRDWTSEEARVAMVRGLMEICGPVTSATIAGTLDIAINEADAALEALEGEGVVLRGHFTPDLSDEIEWCHRRLLARIHRLTMEGLRKQIEPVTVDVFLRFLTRQHGLLSGSKRGGPSGLYETIGMLQGLDLPAVAWERDLLAARLENYRPEWLDELCLTGEVGWGRLFPARRLPDRARPMASLTRVAPLSLFLRSDLEWIQAASVPAESDALSSPARDVLTLLQTQGAMFAADLMTALRLLPDQLNDVLGELVTYGLVTADGFAGLRALLSARAGRSEPTLPAKLSRRRVPLAGAGRWALWRRTAADLDCGSEIGDRRSEPAARSTNHEPQSTSAAKNGGATIAESWAWQLLRRWGVVFRDLLEREPGAPRWFELLQVYRRLEARGEIRGGRFITGVAGEQFAVGDTVRQLRQLRDAGPARELVVISASDPLNLVGILTPHERVPSIASNRVAYLDGRPVAALIARAVKYLVEPTPELQLLLDGGRVLSRTQGQGGERGGKPVQPPTGAPARRKPRRERSLFPRSSGW